jgi:hypothetical protein
MLLAIAAAITRIHDRLEKRYKGGLQAVDRVRRDISAPAIARLTDVVLKGDQPAIVPVVRILAWLGNVHADRALVRLLGDTDTRREIIEALVERGKPVTKLLADQLSSDDFETRRASVIDWAETAGTIPSSRIAAMSPRLTFTNLSDSMSTPCVAGHGAALCMIGAEFGTHRKVLRTRAQIRAGSADSRLRRRVQLRICPCVNGIVSETIDELTGSRGLLQPRDSGGGACARGSLHTASTLTW